ncbi:MAG: NUDIX domain-containing protein [Acidimicrobiales bacterium]
MNVPFRVIATEKLLSSYVFDVERRTVAHNDTTFERDVVTHRGAVAILARNEHDEIGFLRQYRAPFDAFILEVPAGTMDVDTEDELATAKRELREELGCEATSWRTLGRFTVSPGWTNQVMTIFEATGLSYMERAPEGPEELTSTVMWMPIHEIKAALRREPTIDYTVAVALHCVFGSFFDLD